MERYQAMTVIAAIFIASAMPNRPWVKLSIAGLFSVFALTMYLRG